MNPSEPSSTETLRYNEFTLDDTETSSKMKDVIDVLAMQREKRNTLQKSITIDYTKSSDSFTVSRFIFECGLKLEAHPLTIATAATLYHRFIKEATLQGYDNYLIASTCLYLAGKVKDDTLKIRDIMNVSYNTLHRGSQPLDLGDQYWSMRDAIVQAELLIMRMLKFQVTPVHPHKYMLHYLRSLQAWFGEEEWSKYPVAKTSMALLQDFHHSPAILDYPPSLIAIACINLSLQIYGVVVPLMDECDQQPWFNVFCKDLARDKLWEIMEKVMAAYDEEHFMKLNHCRARWTLIHVHISVNRDPEHQMLVRTDAFSSGIHRNKMMDFLPASPLTQKSTLTAMPVPFEITSSSDISLDILGRVSKFTASTGNL